jgi:L-glyceraldehyde reductase
VEQVSCKKTSPKVLIIDFRSSQHHPDMVEAALDDCLEELGLDYLDLYLIHFPVAFRHEGGVGDNLVPRTGDSGPNGVHIDTNISLIDTWRGIV